MSALADRLRSTLTERADSISTEARCRHTEHAYDINGTGRGAVSIEASPTPTAELRSATVSSFGWAWLGVVVQAALQLAYTAVISRLVAPGEFGVIAAAMLVLKFVTYLGRGGILPAVLQRPTLSTQELAGANTLSIVVGVSGALLGFLVAPLAAALTGVPGAASAMRWISLGLLLGAPGIVPEAQLRREMRFRTITTLQVVSYLGSNILLAIPLAMMGHDRAALLTAYLAGVFIYSILVRFTVAPRPGFTARWSQMRRFVRFGGTVALTSLLDVVSSSSDIVYVGRLGSGQLGQYNRASLVIGLPLEQVSTAAAGAARSAMVRLQEDRRRFVVALQTTVGLQAGLAGAAVGFGAAASPALVPLLLGPQWSQAESLLPLVAAAHGLGLVTQQITGAAESVGRVKERLYVQAVHTVINVALISFMFLTTHSPFAVATGWLGGEAIRLVGHMRLAVHHLDASAPALIRRTLDALLVAALAGVAPLIVIRLLGMVGWVGLTLSSLLSLATLVSGYRLGWIGALRGDLTRLGLGDRLAKLRRRLRAH